MLEEWDIQHFDSYFTKKQSDIITLPKEFN